MKLQTIRRRIELSSEFRSYSDAALEPPGTTKEAKATVDVKEPMTASGF